MKVAKFIFVLLVFQSTTFHGQTPTHTPTDFYNQVVTPYNGVWQSSTRLLSVIVHHADDKMAVETEVSGLKTAILSAKTQYEGLATQSPSEQKLKAEALSLTLNLPVQLGLVDIAKPCEETMSYYERTYQSLLEQETYGKNMAAMSSNFSNSLDNFAKEGRIPLSPKSNENERDSVAQALNLIHKMRKTLCEVMMPMEDFFKAAQQEDVKKAGEAIGKLKKVLAEKRREMPLVKAEVAEADTPFEPMALFIKHVNTFAELKKMGAIMQYLQAADGVTPQLIDNYNAALKFYNENIIPSIDSFSASSAAFQKRKVPDVLSKKD